GHLPGGDTGVLHVDVDVQRHRLHDVLHLAAAAAGTPGGPVDHEVGGAALLGEPVDDLVDGEHLHRQVRERVFDVRLVVQRTEPDDVFGVVADQFEECGEAVVSGHGERFLR